MEQIISTGSNVPDNKYRRWIKPLWVLAILLVFPGSFIQFLINPDSENFLILGIITAALMGGLGILVSSSFIIKYFSRKNALYGFRALCITILILLAYDTWYFILQGYDAIHQEYSFRNYRWETAGYLISPDSKSILRSKDAEAPYSNTLIAGFRKQNPKADAYIRVSFYTQNGFVELSGSARPIIFTSKKVKELAIAKYLDKQELVDIIYRRCGDQASYCWNLHDQYIYIDEINSINEFRGEGSIGENLTGQFVSYTPPVKNYYSSAKFKTTTGKIYELWGDIKNGQFIDWNDGHNPLWSLVPKYIDSGETIKIQITGPSHISNQHIKWIYK